MTFVVTQNEANFVTVSTLKKKKKNETERWLRNVVRTEKPIFLKTSQNRH